MIQRSGEQVRKAADGAGVRFYGGRKRKLSDVLDSSGIYGRSEHKRIGMVGGDDVRHAGGSKTLSTARSVAHACNSGVVVSNHGRVAYV
jgi:hypothetical protein